MNGFWAGKRGVPANDVRGFGHFAKTTFFDAAKKTFFVMTVTPAFSAKREANSPGSGGSEE
jgi:hypothetical protein